MELKLATAVSATQASLLTHNSLPMQIVFRFNAVERYRAARFAGPDAGVCSNVRTTPVRRR